MMDSLSAKASKSGFWPQQECVLVSWCDQHQMGAGKCILVWTTHKDPPTCPQCKAPFTSLLTYRKLDGSMSDYPVDESVCLLKRAHWFEAYLKVMNGH